MIKGNKTLIFISILIVFLFTIFILVFAWEDKKKDLDLIKVAACPTFYYKINKLNSDNFSVILTNSTSESLNMLKLGQVDYALGGRILFPHEPNFEFNVVGEAFSFLSSQSKIVYDYQLLKHSIYTDLDIDILKKNFGDLDYIAVDNVYNHLENNIVVTSWDNTDFSRAEIIHLLKHDNSRIIESRLPTVFCYDKCSYNIIDNIKKAIN